MPRAFLGGQGAGRGEERREERGGEGMREGRGGEERGGERGGGKERRGEKERALACLQGRLGVQRALVSLGCGDAGSHPAE